MVTNARLAAPTAALLCIVAGLTGWGLYYLAFRSSPGLDWMVFYTAARAYGEGRLSLLSDGTGFMAALQAHFADWLGVTPSLHPWVYPPHFLLFLLPFGMLPPATSCAVFLAATFVALIAALRLADIRGRRLWLLAGSIVLSPAGAFTIMAGQNEFLAIALLVGGAALLGSQPVAAGLLFGLLSFKPQLCLMVPVALLATRSWRAMASLFITFVVLLLASLLLFGAGLWRDWLTLILGDNAAYAAWSAAGRLMGMSVYACAMQFGAGSTIAQVAQASAVLLAAVAVAACYARPASAEVRLSVLLAATFLAAPHSSNYTAVMLTIGATLLFTRASHQHHRHARLAFAGAGKPTNTMGQGFSGDAAHPIALVLSLLVWISALFNPPVLFPVGAWTPVLTCGFVVWLVLSDCPVASPVQRWAVRVRGTAGSANAPYTRSAGWNAP